MQLCFYVLFGQRVLKTELSSVQCISLELGGCRQHCVDFAQFIGYRLMQLGWEYKIEQCLHSVESKQGFKFFAS